MAEYIQKKVNEAVKDSVNTAINTTLGYDIMQTKAMTERAKLEPINAVAEPNLVGTTTNTSHRQSRNTVMDAAEPAAASSGGMASAFASLKSLVSSGEGTLAWQFGTAPIWLNPAFQDVFFDSVLPSPSELRAQRAKQIEDVNAKATRLEQKEAKARPLRTIHNHSFSSSFELLMLCFSHIVSHNSAWLSATLSPSEITMFTLMLPTLAEIKMYTSKSIHINSRNDAYLLEVLREIHQRISMLPVNASMMVPGGWLQDISGEGHSVMYVVTRNASSFSFAIVNTSCDSVADGTKYHALDMSHSPHTHYKCIFLVEDVSLSRLMDSSVWFMLLRMTVYPSPTHNCEMLYEQCVPLLNQRPLSAIICDHNDETTREYAASEFAVLPKAGDMSLFHCCLESCLYVLRRKGLSPAKCGLIRVLVEWQMCQFMLDDVKQLRSITGNDQRLFQLACQHLAHSACRVTQQQQAMHAPPGSGLTADLLRQIQLFIESVHVQVAQIPRHTIVYSGSTELQLLAQNDATSTGSLLAPDDGLKVQWSAFPLFDRFVRDTDVEALAGLAEQTPIFRPIEFTLVPVRATCLDDVMAALRHTDMICTLLSYQTETIKNTYMLRVSLIQHLFTSVLPVPLPCTHSQRDTLCLWRAEPMRYERQIEMLRLMRLICRHYTTCAMSLKITRSFDAARILTMACMASMADVLVRTRACDTPSLLSLHMDGRAPPTDAFAQSPFGIAMGPFAKQSEYMKFTSPLLVCARTNVLDYFLAQAALIQEDHFIFAFEKDMSVGNVTRLVSQVCWEIGFPLHSDLGRYVTGERRELLLNYPELLYYRDIVFTFKFMMTPTNKALPPIQTWSQNDADLVWKLRVQSSTAELEAASQDQFEVQAFGQALICSEGLTDEEAKARREKERNAGFFARIWGLFTRESRAGPSGADPTALVGQPIDHEEASRVNAGAFEFLLLLCCCC